MCRCKVKIHLTKFRVQISILGHKYSKVLNCAFHFRLGLTCAKLVWASTYALYYLLFGQFHMNFKTKIFTRCVLELFFLPGVMFGAENTKYLHVWDHRKARSLNLSHISNNPWQKKNNSNTHRVNRFRFHMKLTSAI